MSPSRLDEVATMGLHAVFACGGFLLMSVVGFLCDFLGVLPAFQRALPTVALRSLRSATHAFFRRTGDTRSAFFLFLNAATPAASAGFRV